MRRPVSLARRVLALQSVAVGMVLVVACTAGKVKAGPIPTFIVTTTTTPTTADYSVVNLDTVAGTPVVQIPLGPGPAALNGTVTGPDGAVAGAVVHVERVVNNHIGSIDVSTQPDGTWALRSILGGLYRVRAWRVPDLALLQPVVNYLAATDTKTLDLRVDRFGLTQVTSSLAPTPPILGQPAQLVVEVTSSTVDAKGVVRANPKPGAAVQLFGAGQWSVSGSSTKTADSSGLVFWVLTCQQLGAQPMSVVVGAADVFPLDLSTCSPVPSTTTTSGTVGPTTTIKRKGPTTTSA